MAFFAVTLETIDKVFPHPKADRLELATLAGLGFQFVIGKGAYAPGDRVLYFPVDSVLPGNIIESLGLTNLLAGASKNRVKTIRLRDQISQGLVANPNLLGADWESRSWIPEFITTYLNVTKYAPPPNFTAEGVLLPLPAEIGVYDIEGAERFPDVLEQLMDQPVYITEKLEGTNLSAVYENGKVTFCQRSNAIEEIPGKSNIYCEVGRSQRLDQLLGYLVDIFPGEVITLRGELIGPKIQGNYYNLAKNEIRLFDLQYSHDYTTPKGFIDLTQESERVPCISFGTTLRGWLDGRTLQEASNGPSLLNPKVLREGIVIKPLTEQRCKIGRLLIKQRSPLYLSKGDF